MLSLQIAFGIAIFAAVAHCVAAWQDSNKPLDRETRAYLDRLLRAEEARKAALPKRDIISWIAQTAMGGRR
jgi:hypothetical protein